ncbi:MAG: Gfo/Idh/MocA family oxidoreductase [Phycisphaerae bacterium]|nr:Gfo/Idh/MocA family oxidoreductase [Phycisphaerae bacterium]
MQTFTVGVFGIGWVAGEHIKAFLRNPHMRVVGLASRQRASAESKKAELGLDCDIMDDYESLVRRPDVDIIDICSPNVLHAEQAIRAAEAGKHVIIEKPVAMNSVELKAIRDAIVKAGVRSQVGFVSRWNPHVRSIRSMIDKGGLGEIYYVEVDYYHEIGPWWSGWRWGANTRAGGPSASLLAGCHAVDLLYYFGGDVEEVFAYGAFGHRKDYEYEPTYAAVVKFKNGKIGKTGCSFENECPYTMNIMLHGSKGSVLNEKFYSREWFGGQEGWQQFNTTFLDSGDVSHHPFQGMMDDLAAALVEGREATANIHEACKSHEICLAIDRSIETGRAVQLPLI